MKSPAIPLIISSSLLPKLVVVLLAVFLINTADGDLNADWNKWKAAQKRQYRSAAEESNRKAIFARNWVFVNAQNAKPGVSFKLALNALAASTPAELASRRGLIVPPAELAAIAKKQTTSNSNIRYRVRRSIPTNLDWRQWSAVSPVIDQGSCAACYAFSAAGALESRYKLKYGYSLVKLSSQNIIDCSTSFGNLRCAGGNMPNVFKYVNYVHGLDSAAYYPYTQSNTQACYFNANYRYANVVATSPFTRVTQGSEAALIQALQYGPVCTAIDGSTRAFSLYSGGVFYDSTCNPLNLNHAMLLVGYGIDSTTGLPYWLCKNSWGTWWGEKGYVRLRRGVNTCGILNYNSYPNIA